MESVGGGLIFPPSEILDDSSSSEGLNNDVSYGYGDGDDEYSQMQNYSYFMNETYYYDGTYNATFFFPHVTYTLGFKIVIALLYNSVFVLALAGNSLVCYVVFSHPRMRTVTNYLISNLAAGDLLMAVFNVPFSYIPVLLQYWPFGKLLCYILPPAQAVSVFVSSYTLVALAVDRYMAILYPLRPRIQKSQACWGIVVVWLLAILTAVPIAIFTEYYQDEQGYYLCDETGWETMGVENLKLPYSLTLMILQYFFPLIVLIFTYSRITMAVWGKQSLGEAEDSRVQRLAKTKRKTVVMSLVIVACYTLAWLPFNLVQLIGFDKLWHPEYSFFVVHGLAISHSIANPIIYTGLNAKFRHSFLNVLSRLHVICPCLVDLCLAPNSSFSPNHHYNHQYLNSHNSHHSIYVRQQIYGSTTLTTTDGANNSAKSILKNGSGKIQQQQQQQQQRLQNNLRNSAPQNKKAAYQLTSANGAVKSTREGDPLVVITISTTQQIERNNRVAYNNRNLQKNNKSPPKSEGNKKEEEEQEKLLQGQGPGQDAKPSSSAEQQEQSQRSGRGYSQSPPPAPHPTPNHQFTLPSKSDKSPTPSPKPVQILANAKDEDLIDNEGDDCIEDEPPVWT